MAVAPGQWYQMGDPAARHEAEALEKIKALLPDSPITHAWANVTLRDLRGRSDEIDVILLHPVGLFVLELKGWHGRISAKQQWWGATAARSATRGRRFRGGPGGAAA